MEERDMIRELVGRGAVSRMHPSELREIIGKLPSLGFALWEELAFSGYLSALAAEQEARIDAKVAALF